MTTLNNLNYILEKRLTFKKSNYVFHFNLMPDHFNLSNQRSKPKSEWSKSGIPAQSAVQLTLLNKTHSGKTKKCLFYLPRASNNSKSASVLLNLHIPGFRFVSKRWRRRRRGGFHPLTTEQWENRGADFHNTIPWSGSELLRLTWWETLL